MSDETTPQPTEVTRRLVLRGAAVSGLALPVLAACGSSGDSEGGTAQEPAESPEDGSSGGGGGESAGTTVPTSDVPVGGGTIIDQEIVLTQPSKGTFMAFSAICTHQGCPVGSVQGGTINCPCHGSKYSIEDGSVVNGPASQPLQSLSVDVQGDQLKVG